MKSKDDLKKILTNEEYKITQEKWTELPFSWEYNNFYQDWIYKCKICDSVLFDSDAKFDSGCWWPSFDKSIHESAIDKSLDMSHSMIRTELSCAKCWSHLWHLFSDWPTITGNRYCINSASLKFDNK